MILCCRECLVDPRSPRGSEAQGMGVWSVASSSPKVSQKWSVSGFRVLGYGV